MTREQALDEAVRRVKRRHERIDMIVLNCGTPHEFAEVCAHHLWDIRAEFNRIMAEA